MAIRRFIEKLFPAPFQFTLVVAFSLVSAITILVATWVISYTIDDFLSAAMRDRVARDMRLAQAMHDDQLEQLSTNAQRLASDPALIENLATTDFNKGKRLVVIDREVSSQAQGLERKGNRLFLVLDPQGILLSGLLIQEDAKKISPTENEGWNELAVVQQALKLRKSISATEVISKELLDQVGLGKQAVIPMVETAKAAPNPFDSREGQAGFALIGIAPILQGDRLLGLVVALHLFNNDYTLVDQIKEVAGIDTVTIFFGDLRVSTNVMRTETERAIGTRIAEDVGNVILKQGLPYVGPAFVVNENYITRYEPIRDFQGKVIGSLYVGVKQAAYNRLVNIFNNRILLIVAASLLLTLLLAIPLSQRITRPLKELRELTSASHRVAEGDISARAPIFAGGEVGQVANSFNAMLDTLQATNEKLIHTEKLASLGQLAAGVAHELNNPLGSILLYSDILNREIPEGDPKKADLEIILRETNRCKQIVAALLNFARQTRISACPTDLNQLIRETLVIEQKQPGYKNVQVEALLDPTLPVIQADPAQLHEILVNLMTNAVDAMPAGGRLVVRTLNQPAGMVTLEVEDSGEGIPPENMGKLFAPFYTTKPVGKGNGLGLAIIYGIIKMHRGQISVNSQVGKGTQFKITLPVRQPFPPQESMNDNGNNGSITNPQEVKKQIG